MVMLRTLITIWAATIGAFLLLLAIGVFGWREFQFGSWIITFIIGLIIYVSRDEFKQKRPWE